AGGTMRVLRALVFVVDVAMLFFSWRAYRRVAGAGGALVTTALVLLFLHVPLPNHYLVQVRGDVFLVAAIAAGLWAATSDAAWAGGVLAIAAAFAIDVKASGFVYCAPLLVRFAARRGLRAGIVVAIGAAAASALPFAIPNVSLPAYAAWVEAAAHHPRSAHDLLTSLRTLAVFAMVPLAIVGLR